MWWKYYPFLLNCQTSVHCPHTSLVVVTRLVSEWQQFAISIYMNIIIHIIIIIQLRANLTVNDEDYYYLATSFFYLHCSWSPCLLLYLFIQYWILLFHLSLAYFYIYLLLCNNIPTHWIDWIINSLLILYLLSLLKYIYQFVILALALPWFADIQ